ncbi:hypothetical protein PPL_09528 [Heterostelium album PN500]|uniref:WD40 repeat-containing protein n=1 Tax=Heterostelium pallidum (strain ATCC 26659 / Pp 5 / PN500) TaxID=670386 RepID=D3BNB7_HETP5|nr:hypothetical protein PPL_09528 [Heterostelium album PN500]EFA76777.1 hypothetical protein PPL_09528 [Heterostelium album PN500]|eukprot:XP_020428909.1 hypothetical protein PPL_09528 [Heterostelium album PN500]
MNWKQLSEKFMNCDTINITDEKWKKIRRATVPARMPDTAVDQNKNEQTDCIVAFGSPTCLVFFERPDALSAIKTKERVCEMTCNSHSQSQSHNNNNNNNSNNNNNNSNNIIVNYISVVDKKEEELKEKEEELQDSNYIDNELDMHIPNIFDLPTEILLLIFTPNTNDITIENSSNSNKKTSNNYEYYLGGSQSSLPTTSSNNNNNDNNSNNSNKDDNSNQQLQQQLDRYDFEKERIDSINSILNFSITYILTGDKRFRYSEFWRRHHQGLEQKANGSDSRLERAYAWRQHNVDSQSSSGEWIVGQDHQDMGFEYDAMRLDEIEPVDRQTTGTDYVHINLWDIRENDQVRIIKNAHKWEVWQLNMCGGYLFSGSFDHTIKTWDLRTFQNQRTITGHRSYIHALTSSSFHLFSGSADKFIKVNIPFGHLDKSNDH